MRYVGQGFELPVPLPPRGGSWPAWLRAARGRVRRRARADLRPPHRQPDRGRPPPRRRARGGAAAVPRWCARPGTPPDRRRSRPAYFGERFGLLDDARPAPRRPDGRGPVRAARDRGPRCDDGGAARLQRPPRRRLGHRHRGGPMSDGTSEGSGLRGRRDPPRAHPRGPGGDLRGDGGQRHPDLALRDRQERDGLLDRAVRREGRDHRPGRDAAEPARRAARRRRRGPARVRRRRSCRATWSWSTTRSPAACTCPTSSWSSRSSARTGWWPSWRRWPTTPTSAGSVPGSMSPYAEECYQEGLRIPPLRLYAGGVPEHGVFALLSGQHPGARDRARRPGRAARGMRHRRDRAAAR